MGCMPGLVGGFGNYFLPVQMGAPDMANVTKLNKWLCSVLRFFFFYSTYSACNACSACSVSNLIFSASKYQGSKISNSANANQVKPLLALATVQGKSKTKNLIKNSDAFIKAYTTIAQQPKGWNGQYLSHYLAGLIEGDGYITITSENRVILGITFNLKDKPLAEKLLNFLGKGTIVKRQSNSIELRFSSKKTLYKIIHLINGKFRTPKIQQLYNLIDWMNEKHSMDIIKLPLNDSPILNGSWLSGFIDADGNFYIRNSLKQIICKFALEQRMIYPKTNESYNFLLNKICLALNVKLQSRIREGKKDSYYIIRVENQNSIKLLIDYLDIYPLLSSKYLDFLCWKIVFNEIINKNHMTVEGRKIASEQKSQMNDSRTYFNWDHLNNF